MKIFIINKKSLARYSMGMLYMRALMFFSFVYAPNLNNIVPFESPFPANRFTVVLSTCMQAYGDIQLLKQSSLLDDVEYKEIGDLLCGRLSRLRDDVNMMLKNERPGFFDDIEYLAGVLEQMEHMLGELPKKALSINTLYLCKIMTSIRLTLEAALDRVE